MTRVVVVRDPYRVTVAAPGPQGPPGPGGGGGGAVDWGDIGGTLGDQSDLAAALAAKAALSHGHAIADVSGLQTALDGKAASSHGHASGEITNASGVSGGTVTQALNTLGSQLSAVELIVQDHDDQLAGITPFGFTFNAAADAPAARGVLALGTAATESATAFDPAGSAAAVGAGLTAHAAATSGTHGITAAGAALTTAGTSSAQRTAMEVAKSRNRCGFGWTAGDSGFVAGEGRQSCVEYGTQITAVTGVLTDDEGVRVDGTAAVTVYKVDAADNETLLGVFNLGSPTAAAYRRDTTLSGWTRTVAAGDTLRAVLTTAPAAGKHLDISIAYQEA